MRHAAFLLFALTGLCAGCGKTTPATNGAGPGADKDRLQGVWAIESYENGEPEFAPKAGELQNARVVFDGDKVRFVLTGEDVEKFSFVLDTASNPKVMVATELDSEGKPRRRFVPGKDEGEVERQEWIYTFDGDVLVIALSDGPGAKRPTEFKPKAGSGARATKRTADNPYTPPVDVVRLKKTDEPVPLEKPRKSFPTGVTKR